MTRRGWDPIERLPWTPADKLRSKRWLVVLAAYWIANAVVAILLAMLGPELSSSLFGGVAHHMVGHLDGVQRVARHSFNHAHVEISAAFGLSCALVCSMLLVAWSARGNAFRFKSRNAKLQVVLLALAMLTLAWALPEVEGAIGPGEGRTGALFWFAASSRMGVATILGFFYGFGQLLFFAAALACLMASAQGRSATPREPLVEPRKHDRQSTKERVQ